MNAESLTEQLGITVERLIAPALGNLYNAAAVEIRHNTSVVYRGAFGHDLAGQPTRPDTLFDLGSLTELFTVTAFLRLVDSGRLWIDTPVDVVLPDFDGDITFYRLLTHTAGFPLEMALCGLPDYEARIAAILGTLPQPGILSHSPLDCLLMGLAIELLTNLPLAMAMASLILQPTGVRAQFAPLPQHASVTTREVSDANARCLDGIAGHAGLFGTISDVATLAAVYLAHGAHGDTQLLSPKIVAEATRVHTSWGGLGWQVDQDDRSYNGFWHSAAAGNIVWVDPGRRMIITLLTERTSELPPARLLKLLPSLWSELLADVCTIIDQIGE